MHGAVADETDLMKQVRRLIWKNPFEFQTAEKLGLLFLGRGIQACFRRCQLGENFTELAKFNQAGIRIILKVSFGQGAKTDKLRVLLAQEIEIGGKWRHDRSAALS